MVATRYFGYNLLHGAMRALVIHTLWCFVYYCPYFRHRYCNVNLLIIITGLFCPL